ncbi:hypothetical protein ACP3P6_02785 [Enterobacter mori]
MDNNGPDVGACSAFYGCHWFLLKWLALSFLLFPVAVAKKYSIIISMSLLCVWGMKFAVALLCALFSGVMAAHKNEFSQL